MAFRLVLNQHAIDELLNDPNGMVGKDLSRRALNVESRAKLYASGLGGGPQVDTGRLRSSITHELVTRSDGTLVARIGTNVEYAAFVEQGTDRSKPYPYLVPALDAGRI
jgi:phage gpG-like protein